MKKIVIILISVLVINAAKAQLITVYRCNFSNGYVGFNTMAKANAYCAAHNCESIDSIMVNTHVNAAKALHRRDSSNASFKANFIASRPDSIISAENYIRIQLNNPSAYSAFITSAQNVIFNYEHGDILPIINWINNTYPTLTSYYSLARKNKLLSILNW